MQHAQPFDIVTTRASSFDAVSAFIASIFRGVAASFCGLPDPQTVVIF